jgi:selenocysteine lyase/cysteine desulfurase
VYVSRVATVDVSAQSLEQLATLWHPEGVYLDAATYGLPPEPAWNALQAALDEWRGGTGRWEEWSEATQRARESFARLVGVPAERVAVGGTVGDLFGLLATAIPDGTRVLVADNDFTSLLFPLVVQAERGVTLVSAPVSELAERLDPSFGAVAFSAVQSATGEVADLDAIEAAAAEAGALTLLDATQAVGWLPFDAGRFDAVACNAYKWLMSPRGTSFLALGERLAERVRPLHANWFAGESIHESYYGLPLRLSRDARRFDSSPAWFSWVGCAATLELVEAIGVERIHEHDVALANAFRTGLGLEPSNSAIVKVHVPDAASRLERAGIRAASRAGSVRAAFHVYNGEADVDAAVAALS